MSHKEVLEPLAVAYDVHGKNLCEGEVTLRLEFYPERLGDSGRALFRLFSYGDTALLRSNRGKYRLCLDSLEVELNKLRCEGAVSWSMGFGLGHGNRVDRFASGSFDWEKFVPYRSAYRWEERSSELLARKERLEAAEFRCQKCGGDRRGVSYKRICWCN
jgi:hypothetical protein